MVLDAASASDWEIPAFETRIYGPKAHRHVLVIPVINEGEHIRKQLRAIRDAHLSIDVIVADGGSTDGSLDDDFIRTVPVRAVLRKTGPGRLSAQLRMAYAWALNEGYEGIVTIDGNGKDGVEAVTAFSAKLDEGYDYVQGSRYRPGGVAENTPFERTIGNRFIHAPLLSVGGLHRFTDTTNGYRGYSARYLRDPRVAPFRNTFSDYELLFYLTTRAGQLGYRVTEIPVARRYPASGPVPTKINSFGKKAGILFQAVDSCLGRFVPEPGATGRIAPTLNDFLVALFILVPLFLVFGRYSFPYDNHGQELPTILAILNPDLYRGDFAVQSFLGLGPRFFYNYLVASLLWLGLKPAMAYLLLQVCALTSSFTALLTLGRRLANDFTSPIQPWAILLVALAATRALPWHADLIESPAIPGSFAIAIVLWGLVAASASRWALAYLLLGLGALLQFLVGFLPGLLLMPAALAGLYRQRSVSGAVLGFGAWIVCLALIALPTMIADHGVAATAPGQMSTMEFFGFVRVPHHWIPSFAPIWLWPVVACAYLAGIVLLLGAFLRSSARIWAPALVAVIVIGALFALMNYVFVEVVFISFIGKLQFQRALPFVHLTVLLATLGSAMVLWKEKRLLLAAGLVLSQTLALGGVLLLVFAFMARKTERMPMEKVIVLALLAIGLLAGPLLEEPFAFVDRILCAAGLAAPLLGYWLAGRIGLRAPAATAVLGVLSILFAAVIFAHPFPGSLKTVAMKQWNLDRQPDGDVENLAVKLQTVTSPHDLVLIPPTWGFSMFGLRSERPVYFSFKNIPYTEKDIETYRNRLRTLAGAETGDQDQLESLYAARSRDDLLKIARDNGATIIVDKTSLHRFDDLKPIATEGDWSAWRIE